MIPFNTPRQFLYDSYQPSYAQYFVINNPPNDENGGNKDTIGYDTTNTMNNNTSMNNEIRINYRSNSEFGMNFAPIAYTPERNGFGPPIGKHKKSKSLPKTQFPLINKFQNSLNKTSTKTHGNSGVHLSNKVNFPVHQLSLDIPLENIVNLQSIYHQIETKKYSTSAIDPLRNYVTVYEYSINNHWIIWDYETGFVHLTGIWKASINDEVNTHRNLKADIVKLLESTPKQYHQHIKRIRGGFLKIQGTWLPFDLCKMLAKRFCYHIRFQLIPIFGNTFPLECLTPDDKGFGELKLDEYMNGSVKNGSRQGNKTHKVVKRQSNSLLESPVIKRASSTSYLPMPMTNQFPNPNSMPIQNTPQRLPQFTFPQTTGSYSQQYKYQENTSQYALSSSTHNSYHTPHSSSLSLPQNQLVALPSTQSVSLQTPYQASMHILPSSQQSSALYHSPHSYSHAAENTFHTPYEMPQHLLHTPSHTNLVPGNLAQHTPSSDMSYHDMIDLVNASKCLQSLSQTQISPISHEPLSNRDYVASIPKSPTSTGNGISSILLAAGVSDDRIQSSNRSRRISMKINDILS